MWADCWEYRFGDLLVVQLPVLRDNYSYLLHDQRTGQTVALDPADDPAILAHLQLRGWQLKAIWNTHWHHDHAGGNPALLSHGWKHRPEVLAASPRMVPDTTHAICSGDFVFVGGHCFQVHEAPAHTLDHLVFSLCDAGGIKGANGNTGPAVFSGDALFSLGCGRLFEGDAHQLVAAMQLFLQFGDATKLFCAHEYTRANLGFALSLEPLNQDLRQYAERLSALNGPSIPTTKGFERRANPFLRLCRQPEQPAFRRAMCVRVPEWDSWNLARQMAYLRQAKDRFQT